MAKKRGLLLIILSLLMAVGAAYTANRWVAAQVVADDTDGVRIVAAAMSIPYGTKVEERHLKFVDVPDDARPAGAFTTVDNIVGSVSIVPISRGEILIADRFAAHDSGSTLAALVGENMRALTVRVNDVIGVAGFLLPGNRVDVLASRKSSGSRAITETILRDIKVLAVDQTATTQKNEPVIVRAVTLEMTPQQAEILVNARTEGEIQLSLRNPLEVPPDPTPEPEVQAKPKQVVAKKMVQPPSDSTKFTIISVTKFASKKTKN